VRCEETFLFYGEDYQGYGCLKCSTGERADFLPPGYCHGAAFCWAKKDDQDSLQKAHFVESHITASSDDI
jgi:hypothetical protein